MVQLLWEVVGGAGAGGEALVEIKRGTKPGKDEPRNASS